MNTTASRYRIIGIEDSDGDRCECCGTPCPKRRVVLRPIDGGSDRRFGSLCAALAMRGERTQAAARQIEAEARETARRERAREQQQRTDAFIEFVARQSSKATHFERLRELGGYSRAKELFIAA